MYIYIHTYIHTYIHIYIYFPRPPACGPADWFGCAPQQMPIFACVRVYAYIYI